MKFRTTECWITGGGNDKIKIIMTSSMRQESHSIMRANAWQRISTTLQRSLALQLRRAEGIV